MEDPPVSSPNELGDWLHAELAAECYVEDAGWATERVARVQERLQQGRPADEVRTVVVLWSAWANAFTVPGRYVYITRPLLERCPHDEAAAFVIAHELAHHDLGHTRLFPQWMAGISSLAGAFTFGLLLQALEKRLYGPERECDADRHGLDLCLAAGYDPDRCLEVLDILALYALDHGDHEIVYGPDPESDQELSPNASWRTRAKIWAWQRYRGYLPLRDRTAMLRQHLATRGEPRRLAA